MYMPTIKNNNSWYVIGIYEYTNSWHVIEECAALCVAGRVDLCTLYAAMRW